MPLKPALFVLTVVVLAIRTSTSVRRGCAPTEFGEFQPLLRFKNAKDTGLLWMYALYTPPRPKKLSRTDMLLRTRSLIVILLIVGSVESNPGEFVWIFCI